MRFSRAGGPGDVGWAGDGKAMGRGHLAWKWCGRDVLGHPSHLGRADGVWGGSQRVAGSRGGCWVAIWGYLRQSGRGGKAVGKRDEGFPFFGGDFSPLCHVP